MGHDPPDTTVTGPDPSGPAEPLDPLDLLDVPSTGSVQRLGPLVWIMSGLMVVMGIATSLLILRGFESDSYWYLGFYSIPSNTAISLFPHEPVLIYFGKEGAIWPTAIWASAGTLVAAVMDYLVFVPVLNYEGIKAYKEKRLYRKMIRWFMRWPFWTLVIAGFTPVPFFPFKFLCFSIRYPLWKFLAAVVVSRFPRYLMYAWLGATIPIPNWILIASVLVIFGLYAVKAVPAGIARLKARRSGLTEEHPPR